MTFTNEGVLDRIVRILVGSSLAYVAWITWPGAAAIVLLLIAGIAVVTGLTGWCLLYRLFHISTKRGTAA